MAPRRQSARSVPPAALNTSRCVLLTAHRIVPWWVHAGRVLANVLCRRRRRLLSVSLSLALLSVQGAAGGTTVEIERSLKATALFQDVGIVNEQVRGADETVGKVRPLTLFFIYFLNLPGLLGILERITSQSHCPGARKLDGCPLTPQPPLTPRCHLAPSRYRLARRSCHMLLSGV